MKSVVKIVVCFLVFVTLLWESQGLQNSTTECSDSNDNNSTIVLSNENGTLVENSTSLDNTTLHTWLWKLLDLQNYTAILQSSYNSDDNSTIVISNDEGTLAEDSTSSNDTTLNTWIWEMLGFQNTTVLDSDDNSTIVSFSVENGTVVEGSMFVNDTTSTQNVSVVYSG